MRLRRWWRLRGTETWRHVKPWPQQSGFLEGWDPNRWHWDGRRLWKRIR